MEKTRCIIDDNTVIIDGVICGTLGYDKRQEKFLFMHEAIFYEKGFKMYYGSSKRNLEDNINKKLKLW